MHEQVAPSGDSEWASQIIDRHRALLRELRRRFEALRSRRERCRQLLDGDDLDLDAWVEDFADRRAGWTGSGRLYAEARPRGRDLSVALLIDVSGSTDAWVGGGRRRVVDVEKEATLVFSAVLETLRDRYAIYAFSGRGPRGVRVLRVKGFAETADSTVYARIAGLAEDRFTRLGAPVRHLTALLAQEATRHRLLLLLSDGKPDDEDEYEGAYGIEDTRQAAVEARLARVDLFCLTVDRGGPAYLPRMFGSRGYTVLTDVTQLPARLPEIYRGLTQAVG